MIFGKISNGGLLTGTMVEWEVNCIEGVHCIQGAPDALLGCQAGPIFLTIIFWRGEGGLAEKCFGWGDPALST